MYHNELHLKNIVKWMNRLMVYYAIGVPLAIFIGTANIVMIFCNPDQLGLSFDSNYWLKGAAVSYYLNQIIKVVFSVIWLIGMSRVTRYLLALKHHLYQRKHRRRIPAI